MQWRAVISNHGTPLLWCISVINLMLLVSLVVYITSPSQENLRKIHYETETATLVSPHGLRERMEEGKNPYVIVDVREKEHYILGHITGALSIPPKGDIVKKFKEIQVKNPNKELLIYCYTQVCMRGRKVGRELAKHGVYVRELGIGFQEWKNDWKKWNYEWEWEHIDMTPLITIGEKPGVFIPELGKHKKEGCGTSETFSC